MGHILQSETLKDGFVFLSIRDFLQLGALGPATVLYMSTFYTRTELQFRIALFLSTICIAAAVSGLLTYEIIKLDGRWGHPGWAWVFLASVFFSTKILAPVIEKAKLLTDCEKNFLISRLQVAWKAAPSLTSPTTPIQKYPGKSTKAQICDAFKSPHVILMSIAQFASTSNIYSVAYFTPTVVTTVRLSYWSDRYQSRSLAAGFSATLAIIGFAIFYGSNFDKLRYASLFLSIPGVYGVMPSLAAWTADNSEPHVRKAAALACGGMVANIGGLFSIWIFTLGQPPRYALPTTINIFLAALIVVCCIVNVMWLRYAERNKVTKRDEILHKFTLVDSDENSDREKDKMSNDPSDQVLISAQAWDHLGDKHPDYKYTY
ncbi:hypothetical protein PGTUg99_036908 [Puccinia graminis f. sp. tritici]|uniref:Major facilitator superfamily (MFS) profile domain-containing protein n=1 Tax=Puccinia graminis f. sp. tritici TaxID=56615 RepID=A0A5B0PMK7_PUCGR|nr:hypothetical protein PGTUg99_036908 [Puccinia graminis f. sp. tritici]